MHRYVLSGTGFVPEVCTFFAVYLVRAILRVNYGTIPRNGWLVMLVVDALVWVGMELQNLFAWLPQRPPVTTGFATARCRNCSYP